MMPLCKGSNLTLGAVILNTLYRRKCYRCAIVHPAEVLLLDALCLAETIDMYPLFLKEGFTVGLE